MRVILFGLFFISILTACRKKFDYSSDVMSPPPVQNPPKPPTYQTTNDSIITMIQFQEDFPILKERDTMGNSTWDRSLPLLVFWTKGNKRYLYRRAAIDDNKYIADYTGNYDLIDTLQSPSPLNDNWADWMKAYSVNKQLLDSTVFTLQVNGSTLHKMYLTEETKLIAASFPTSPMFMGRWINSVFKRIRGQKYKLITVEETVSLKDNILKHISFDNHKRIDNESDTTANYIERISLETETGKRFIYGGARSDIGRYKADYVGKMDLINVTADTLRKPDYWEDYYAIFQINLPVVDTVGFVVHTLEGNVRKFYLSNRTTIGGPIHNMPVRFMATWYNTALNRLRGSRFYGAYYGY